ncbi:MAG TPA: acyl-CoA dehydrogenase family protein [Desulfosalsimonadaceae bacterium]|nr:acyl-CoA dehydrogenase family protein [Desulfosalsimonadaceae bacterium]
MNKDPVKYGLFAEAPDLLKSLPALEKLKKQCPAYIKQAESAQKICRRFARQEMLPRVLETDEKCRHDPAYFDWDLWKRANELKLTIAAIPEKMGGLGWSALSNAVMVEELGSACLASASNITFNTFGLLGALVECRTGTVIKIIQQMVEAQKKGKPLFWSWAITEPSAGTDMEEGKAMAAMRPSTRADKVEDGYTINGTKCFITNGSLAHYVIANIPTDSSRPRDSMATFLIPTDAKGFAVGRVERKCGQKASQTAEIFFRDVFVPAENMWEPPGSGLRHTREILSITRGYIGVAALGLAKGALSRCVDYAARKNIGGRRLIDEAWVRFSIADMAKDIEVFRNAAYNFAVALDARHVWQMFEVLPVKAALKTLPESLLASKTMAGLARKNWLDRAGPYLKRRLVDDETIEDFVGQGSAVKVAATDLAVRTASRVLDIVGIEGMAAAHGMEKYFRDAKISQIYEGTNQANRIDIFNHDIGAIL